MTQPPPPEWIRSDFQSHHQEMSRDGDELAARAKSPTAWNQQFRERPMAVVGAVVAGGLVLGLLTGGSGKSSQQHWSRPQPERGQPGIMGWVTDLHGPLEATQAGKERAAQRLDEILGALVGLAATRAQQFLGQTMPGFKQEREKSKQQGQQQAVVQERTRLNGRVSGANG